MRAWTEGEHVYVAGAVKHQKQRATVIGPDPNDSARVLVAYAKTIGEVQIRSVHPGRLRPVEVLTDAAAEALAQGMTGIA